jgi:hypothetical protein
MPAPFGYVARPETKRSFGLLRRYASTLRLSSLTSINQAGAQRIFCSYNQELSGLLPVAASAAHLQQNLPCWLKWLYNSAACYES